MRTFPKAEHRAHKLLEVK